MAWAGTATQVNDHRESYFDQAHEFPNYFLPEAYRNLTPEQIPGSVVQFHQELLEKAVTSILRRVTLPIVKPGANEASMVQYFDYVRAEIIRNLTAKGIPFDPDFELLASGGVVRATIGYVYHRLRTKLDHDPTQNPGKLLEEIIHETREIPSLEIRGVGSDWDLLVRTKDGKVEPIADLARAITNSAESHYGFYEVKDSIKNAIFAAADVKEFGQQIDRTTRQGGSTLDFIAMDVRRGKFVSPTDHPEIVPDLIRGQASYVGPKQIIGEPVSIEDADKQTVRGLRSLLELPFLRIKDSARLKQELKTLIGKVDSGQLPTPKAIEQFGKMIRNARYGGARNRFYRGQPDSVEALALELARRIHNKLGSVVLPEFTDHLGVRSATGIPERFLTKLSSNKLYHGTGNPQNGLAILRKGLFLSKPDGQGVAVYGRGAYTSLDPLTAQAYAGQSGVVFDLEVRSDRPVNILDWEKYQNEPELLVIKRKAEAEHRDVFEYLAKEHGIDIILNHHVLVQNADVIRFPEFRNLILPYAHQVQNKAAAVEERIAVFQHYGSLYSYATALGETGLPTPTSIRSMIAGDVMNRIAAPTLRLEAKLTHLKQLRSLGVLPPDPLRRQLIGELEAGMMTKSYPATTRSTFLDALVGLDHSPGDVVWSALAAEWQSSQPKSEDDLQGHLELLDAAVAAGRRVDRAAAKQLILMTLDHHAQMNIETSRKRDLNGKGGEWKRLTALKLAAALGFSDTDIKVRLNEIVDRVYDYSHDLRVEALAAMESLRFPLGRSMIRSLGRLFQSDYFYSSEDTQLKAVKLLEKLSQSHPPSSKSEESGAIRDAIFVVLGDTQFAAVKLRATILAVEWDVPFYDDKDIERLIDEFNQSRELKPRILKALERIMAERDDLAPILLKLALHPDADLRAQGEKHLVPAAAASKEIQQLVAKAYREATLTDQKNRLVGILMAIRMKNSAASTCNLLPRLKRVLGGVSGTSGR